MAIDKSFMPIAPAAKLASMAGEFKKPRGVSYNKPEKCLEAYKLLKLRVDKLKMVGRPLSNQNLLSLIRAAQEITDCQAPIAREMLQPFYNCLITRKLADLICWQIAGNRKRMLDRQVHIYNGRKEERGWMSAVIAEHLHDPKTLLGCYRIRVVDGPAAGFDFYIPVPKSLRLLSDVIGATYKVDKARIKLEHPKEAVQMQVMVYPELVKINEFKAHAEHTSFAILQNVNAVYCLKAGSGQKRRNAALAKKRVDKCPEGHKNPCHQCRVGYDACERGCKPKSTIELPEPVELLIKGKNLCQKILEEA